MKRKKIKCKRLLKLDVAGVSEVYGAVTLYGVLSYVVLGTVWCSDTVCWGLCAGDRVVF